MKITLLITYFNRKEQLIKSLKSLQKTKLDRSLFETLLIDDASDEDHRIEDILSDFKDLNIRFHRFTPEEKTWGSRTQAIPLNRGIDMANGEFILISGAEMYYRGDVLSDFYKRVKDNKYIVYSTLSLTKDQTFSMNVEELFHANNQHMWYTHSKHNSTKFFFCAGMSKKDLIRVGKFAEEFKNAEGKMDNYFIDCLNHHQIEIEEVDDPYVLHLWHKRIRRNITVNRDQVYNNLVKKLNA